MELRSPDPEANPYLAYALLIYAGLSGIEENLAPEPSLDVNLYTADPEMTAGLKRLPATLAEAAAAARRSEFVQKYVPSDILEIYCERV